LYILPTAVIVFNPVAKVPSFSVSILFILRLVLGATVTVPAKNIFSITKLPKLVKLPETPVIV
jgi:hypothetical protein